MTGQKGARGSSGPPGERGRVGVVGDAGEEGAEGSPGRFGAPGGMGPVGEPGASGRGGMTQSWSISKGTCPDAATETMRLTHCNALGCRLETFFAGVWGTVCSGGPPPSRTKWTRLVHLSVLTGHVSSLSPRRRSPLTCLSSGYGSDLGLAGLELPSGRNLDFETLNRIRSSAPVSNVGCEVR